MFAAKLIYSKGPDLLLESIKANMPELPAQKKDRFIDEYNLSFPVLLDSKGEVERLYPSMTVPFTYVIDRKGRVVARVDGAKNWESEETFEAIEYLLKKS